MKLTAILSILSAFIVSTSAIAAEFPWAGVGTAQVEVPEGWTAETGNGKPVGIYIKATAPNGTKAVLQISLMELPRPIPDKAALEQIVNAGSAQVLPSSVEGKADIKLLEIDGGFGMYVQFTDKSLVGKEVPAAESRVMRTAYLSLEPKFLVVATILFDDPTQAEVEQMMKAVKSIKIKTTP
ncbi:hypothetical protein [Roseimicrobium sp. ORNL1]|uniref:hypothetical protein n=1 Tax=Roseimicrobium sp. ORNL1 TaxID=2711231 RepID=UPI0013E15C66|nr:hypothetical protein [Roseimicrobium sp. ORNL1]QIF03246.1 hypothetical protein G5S37_17525 [Roseimicrobium sp. ORNL1]